MQFKLHNSSSIFLSEPLTKGPVTLEIKDAYVESSAASLVRQLSGFGMEYWEDYTIADYNWLIADAALPVSVQNFLVNYHRALALTILQRESLTLTSMKKILNIVLGKPFAILEGPITIESSGDYFLVHQSVEGEVAVTYKLSKVHFASFEYVTGDTIPLHAPLLGNSVLIKEALTDKTWFSTYDPDGAVPLEKPAGAVGDSTDYDLSINKVLAIENIINNSTTYENPTFRYSRLFLQKILKRILKKDIIFLFKETISG